MLNAFHTAISEGPAQLSREESHHLVSVRRARKGENVCLLDGQGAAGEGSVAVADPKRAVVDVRRVTIHTRPSPALCLIQALPKGKTMELVVQKAAELGAARIIPVHTRNSEARLDETRAARKVEKWRSAAVESLKQCGNPFLPEILEPIPLDSLPALAPAGLKIVASLESCASSMGAVVRDHAETQAAWVAIGPEGDFDASEYAYLRDLGFLPVTLGPNVLRLETAAIAALAVISELYRIQKHSR